MKKSIIISLVVVLGLVGLMFWGRSNQVAELSGLEGGQHGSLVAPETVFDFGTISMAKGNVETKFMVTNPTTEEVTISSIVTSCMCTVAYLEGVGETKGPFGMSGHGGPVAKANEIIKAGESREIRVVYDPNAHGPAGVGPINRFIDLTEATGGITRLEIRAVIMP